MISIIIPVYNASAFLELCLDSIVSQSYQGWECILVDDGSTDNSSAISDKWAEKDSRITVIHQKNAGVSAARNAGIKKAKGEWIAFVDSDDWLEPDYLTSMLSQADGADLVVSGQIREYDNGHSVIYQPDSIDRIVIEPNHAEKFNELNVNFLLYAPHEKLFRTNIIKENHLTFQVGCSYGEDLQFVYSYLEFVNSIKTINRALYHYRIANSGTLSTKFRENQFEEDYRQWKMVFNYYDRHGLLNISSNEYLARRLWGIVYDGIFLYPHLKGNRNRYISNILSIPEIEYLKKYDYIFDTAKWIKWAILNRCIYIFYLYFFIIYKK